jgi:hypothetical protein
MALEVKKCRGCEELLPLSTFNRDASGRNGLKARCKSCTRVYTTNNAKRNTQKNMLKSQSPIIHEESFKECQRCHKVLELIYFFRDKSTEDGRNCYCKSCHCEATRLRTETRRLQTGKPKQKSGGDHVQAATDLYVMRNPFFPNIVKIGRAKDASRRAWELSAAQPFIVEVIHEYPGYGHLELTLHDRLVECRVESGRGKEWFTAQSDQADAIIRGAIAEWELAHP